MTAAAREAIDKSSVVVGYEVYVDLIRPLLAGKTVATTPMKREVDRCQMALEYALAGETVSMVCSGDAGVYGMAGVMMEVAREHPEVEMEVVCGITAACSAAAVLGAPLIDVYKRQILKDGESMTEDEIKTFVEQHMAKHKVPQYVDFVDSFPMNAAGKILKYVMREQAVEKLNLQDQSKIETA